jgi:hypothetical protein
VGAEDLERRLAGQDEALYQDPSDDQLSGVNQMRREACGVTARLLRWFPLQCTARSTLCHFLNLLLVELPTLRDQPSTPRMHKLQPTKNGDHSAPMAKDHEATIVSPG